MKDDKDDDVFGEKDWLFRFVVTFLPSLSFGLGVAYVLAIVTDLKDGLKFYEAWMLNISYLAWAATLYCIGRVIPLFLKLARKNRIYP